MRVMRLNAHTEPGESAPKGTRPGQRLSLASEKQSQLVLAPLPYAPLPALITAFKDLASLCLSTLSGDEDQQWLVRVRSLSALEGEDPLAPRAWDTPLRGWQTLLDRLSW